jgi:hypothetical protein
MRKRVVRAVVFVAVALGVAMAGAGAAGAVGLQAPTTNGVFWD